MNTERNLTERSCPFSKTTRGGAPLGPVTSPSIFDWVYSTRCELSPEEEASDLIIKRLVTPSQSCHCCAHGLISPGCSVLLYTRPTTGWRLWITFHPIFQDQEGCLSGRKLPVIQFQLGFSVSYDQSIHLFSDRVLPSNSGWQPTEVEAACIIWGISGSSLANSL